jgi:hypothetical protein
MQTPSWKELHSKKTTNYEENLRERIANKYGLERPEVIDLDAAQRYELEYLHSPEKEIENFLDQLEQERKNWRQ